MTDLSSQPAVPGLVEGPEVSVMLVNWNTREMTLDCLRTVFAQTRSTPFEVILVDNGSADGSAEAIAAEFPQVVLMAEQENHGFAKATNISVERARGKYVLLLNTDTLVLDRAIDKLVEFAEANPEARIWGGRTVFEDGSLNPNSSWGKITPWSMFCFAAGLSMMFRNSALFNPEAYGGWQRDTPREIDVVQGSFLLITKAFWDELGGFDPVFFMYGEEADLCARARARGARPKMTPEATIVHFGGRSTKLFADREVYMMGSRVGLINRHFHPFWRPFGRAMTLMWAGWRTAVYRIAAKVTPRYKERDEHCAKVWQRRSEWRHGPRSKAI